MVKTDQGYDGSDPQADGETCRTDDLHGDEKRRICTGYIPRVGGFTSALGSEASEHVPGLACDVCRSAIACYDT